MSHPPPTLLIHYNFPPVQAIGAVRNYELAKGLSRHTQVHIITSTNTRRVDNGGAKREFRLYFARCLDYKTLATGTSTSPSTPPLFPTKARFKAYLQRFVLTFPFLLFFDRGGLIYILHGYWLGCRLLRKEHIRVMYSSYQPYADHVIAYLLKKTFPALYWIADMRDQPVDEQRQNVLWPQWQHRFNRQLLGSADSLTTVSEGVKKNIRRYNPVVNVIHNGIDPVRLARPKGHLPSVFRLAYTGTLYPEAQDPSLLLNALSNLIRKGQIDPDRVEILYAGRNGSTWDGFVQRHPILLACNSNRGLVSREEALEIQESAVINLLLSWANVGAGGILTGKLYEYLASGRPVLAIINGILDPELVQLIETPKLGKVMATQMPDAIYRLEAFILHLYQCWMEQRPSGYSPTPGQLDHLTWPKLSDRLFQLFPE